MTPCPDQPDDPKRAVTRDPLNAAAWHRKVVVHAPAMGTTATANNYRLHPVTIHAK